LENSLNFKHAIAAATAKEDKFNFEKRAQMFRIKSDENGWKKENSGI